MENSECGTNRVRKSLCIFARNIFDRRICFYFYWKNTLTFNTFYYMKKPKRKYFIRKFFFMQKKV